MPYADVNDISMYYEEHGEGFPLVLLHGATGSIDATSGWPTLLPEFSKHYRCLAVEHRGHGHTDNPAESLAYTLVADDIAKFLESLDIPTAHIAGFSDGATIGLFLAKARPDLVSSLVSIGANVWIDDRLKDGLAFFDPGTIERDEPEFAQLFAERHDPHHHPGYWKELVTLVRSNAESELTWSFDDLATIDTPVLVVAGEGDFIVSLEHAMDIWRGLPNAELFVLNSAGMDGMDCHRVHHTRPDIVGPVILDFLGRHTS